MDFLRSGPADSVGVHQRLETGLRRRDLMQDGLARPAGPGQPARCLSRDGPGRRPRPWPPWTRRCRPARTPRPERLRSASPPWPWAGVPPGSAALGVGWRGSRLGRPGVGRRGCRVGGVGVCWRRPCLGCAGVCRRLCSACAAGRSGPDPAGPDCPPAVALSAPAFAPEEAPASPSSNLARGRPPVLPGTGPRGRHRSGPDHEPIGWGRPGPEETPGGPQRATWRPVRPAGPPPPPGRGGSDPPPPPTRHGSPPATRSASSTESQWTASVPGRTPKADSHPHDQEGVAIHESSQAREIERLLLSAHAQPSPCIASAPFMPRARTHPVGSTMKAIETARVLPLPC